MKQYGFGVDIGGTTCKIGFFDMSGTVLEKWEIRTNTENGGASILNDVAAEVLGKLRERGIKKEDVQGIGLGVPGPVGSDGTVYKCVNLGWDIFNVETELYKKTGLLVKAGNDANVAALGEMWQGGGKGCKNLVLFTVGTGVGGGVICDGRIVAGATGGGGEVGHLPTPFHPDWQCSCGKYGCLEVTASASGIIRAAMEFFPFREMGKVTAKDVFDAAAAGDENARRVVDEAGYALGYAAAVMGCAVNPEVILVGGGVSAAGRALLDPVEDSFRKNVFPPCGHARFAQAELGNNAGIIGGAALFFTGSAEPS